MNKLLTAGCVFPAGIKYLYWKKILIPKFNKKISMRWSNLLKSIATNEKMRSSCCIWNKHSGSIQRCLWKSQHGLGHVVDILKLSFFTPLLFVSVSWALESPFSRSFTKFQKYLWTFVHDTATKPTFMPRRDRFEIVIFHEVRFVATNSDFVTIRGHVVDIFKSNFSWNWLCEVFVAMKCCLVSVSLLFVHGSALFNLKYHIFLGLR